MKGEMFPTRLHDSTLMQVIGDFKLDANVLGVLLIGSLARGTARQDSDIDLILIHASGERVSDRRSDGPVVVEWNARTAEAWIKQFTPLRVGDESWGYAFLDGVILHDPRGVVAQLIEMAIKSHANYRVPREIVDHFIWLWNHVRPKMEAVLRCGDETEMGWSVAVMSHPVIQTLWAVNDLPLPSLDLGCLQRHLDDLAIPAEASDLIREMLQAPPEPALHLQLRILELAVPYLEQQNESR